ncbi:Bifunctional DNA primase/polymerase, N-terminal [Prauserella aidingensis]|uniref:bifunctional DNA primase/polymerase n=1 Tax=Prauserella aidingensis TaxID=387890 RepID=UPI0020A38DC1|nr:bifunctional DNA primase/polymerase [Prauserella aidingensis]MCP2255231.1 Bifunctional DNA primase/polymerase, N-terminal [Prauserella aidingensis]
MNGRKQLTRVALDAAARGWHVFPLAVGGKRPALHGATRCPGTGPCADGHRGWEQRATTDPDRIRRAWAHAPYNVGIATGPSGLCVLDLDTAEPGEPVPERWAKHGVRGGEDVLAIVATEAEQDVPGDTLTVATPSGGLHLYFAAPSGVELRNTGGDAGRGLGWKVDTRAGGGYVVAPGSVTGTGAYRYIYDGPVAPLPEWLADRLAPTPLPEAPTVPIRPATGRADRYVTAAVREECRRVSEARTDRNATLYAAAVALGQLVAGGALPDDEARQALRAAAGRHIGVRQFSAREADKTITSGMAAGAHRPRQVA